MINLRKTFLTRAQKREDIAETGKKYPMKPCVRKGASLRDPLMYDEIKSLLAHENPGSFKDQELRIKCQRSGASGKAGNGNPE